MPSRTPTRRRALSRPRCRPHPLALALFLACQAHAAEQTLGTITVEADKASQGPEVRRDRDNTEYGLSGAALDTLGSAAASNPYQAVAELPSVQAPTVDAWGLVNVPGSFKGLRVRGENTSHGGNGTIDGIPLTGINPGPGYQWMFDMENIESVSMAQGPIPPDRLDFFNTAGSLDSRLRWPSEKFGGQVGVSYGDNQFVRLFGRLDSGRSAYGTAMFVSASETSAGQWRGSGDAPDYLRKVSAGFDQDLGALNIKLMLVHSEMAQDLYRPLNYAQASDLSAYRDLDYSKTSSALPAEAIYYQGYNTQNFIDSAALAEISYRFGNDTKVVVKPFYAKEEGSYFTGIATNNKVREWSIDHDWYGLTAELQTRVADTGLKVGYWWESLDPPGPPTRWTLYNTTASGDLAFSNWALLADTTSRQKFQSVYAVADHRFGALKVEGGARYVAVTLPSIKTYNTMGIGDVSFDTALDQSSGVIAARSADGHTDDYVLPYLALGYTLNPNWSTRVAVGRNLAATALEGWPTFQSSYASFAAKGVTAQQLWDKVKPGTQDGIDLSLRYETDKLFLQPTLYYARYHDKSVSYYDPDAGAVYAQNVGEAEGMGIQLVGGWQARPKLYVFGSASWGRELLTENVKSVGGATLDVEGKQMPDVPRVMASVGASWEFFPTWSFSPLVHYLGKRYADSMHQEKVGGYTRVDLDLSKKSKTGWGELSTSLAVVNLFDRKYIGLITAADVQGTGAYSFYPGAPLSVMGKMSLSF